MRQCEKASLSHVVIFIPELASSRNLAQRGGILPEVMNQGDKVGEGDGPAQQTREAGAPAPDPPGAAAAKACQEQQMVPLVLLQVQRDCYEID